VKSARRTAATTTWTSSRPIFAGEAIATELEHPGTYLAIRSVIYQSRAILMLIDSMAIRDAGRDETFSP